MANASIDIFNFYRRYRWRAQDFTDFQSAVLDYTRGHAEGTFGAACLGGFEVASSGTNMHLQVQDGIGVGATGYLHVISAAVDLTFAAPSANPRKDLIVARPNLINEEYITRPTTPNDSVPLKTALESSIVVITGVEANSPAYPATAANDVIIGGVFLRPSQTIIADVDLDFEIRDIPGKNSNFQQNAAKYDDRLRPFASTTQILGVKPSQLAGPFARAFSYVSSQKPSIFPQSSVGVYVQSDTLVNFQSGAITGGDAVSADFTPSIPTLGNAIVATVSLTNTDTLQVNYGTLGTRAQCYSSIINQTVGVAAGNLATVLNNKLVAFVLVFSNDGVNVTSIQIFDCRGVSSFSSVQAGLGSAGRISKTSFPFTPQVSERGIVYEFDTSAFRAGQNIQMPAPTADLIFTFKDVGFNLATWAPVTFLRDVAGTTMEGIAADYVARADGGSWTWQANGTGWRLVA